MVALVAAHISLNLDADNFKSGMSVTGNIVFMMTTHHLYNPKRWLLNTLDLRQPPQTLRRSRKERANRRSGVVARHASKFKCPRAKLGRYDGRSLLIIFVRLRLRRVKCDETKPECNRCINYWGSCGGYAVDPAQNTNGECTREIAPAGEPRRPLPLIQPRVGPCFESDKDLGYFEIFRDQTAATLGGAFDSYIWGGIIPQACAQEPFVVDAMVAIGALTRTMYEVQRYRRMGIAPKTGLPCLGNSPDHEYAMQQYGKALRGMRQAALCEDKDIRMALIACLLVVCFEGFHGAPVAAMTHAAHGVNLLHCWLEKYGGSEPSLLKSPAPNIIEDELIYAFNRLDLQVLTFFDTRPVEYHKDLLRDIEPLKRMPTLFLSLRQARAYWDYIMRRSCHFLASAMFEGKADELEKLRGQGLCDDAVELPGGVNTFSTPKEVPHWLSAERDAHVSEITRWQTAYEPLLKSFQTPAQKQSLGFLGSTILQVHSVVTKIMLRGAFFASEMGYDALLPDFQGVYALVESVYERLITSVRDRVSYHFDPSVLPALFLLLARCRDRMLRRAAIRLLTGSFHREGTWDSLAIARVGAWIMAVEETGVDTVEIPDHRRARMTKFHVDLHARKAQMRCYQRANAGDEEVVWTGTTLTW